MKVLCLLTALFVIAASAPVDTIEECESFYGEKRAKNIISFWKPLSVIKDPSLYDGGEAKDDKDRLEESIALFLAVVLSDDLKEDEKRKVLVVLDIASGVEEILEGLFSFLKATLPEGANPTEEEVVEIAKKISEVFSTTDFRFRQFTDKIIMSNATVHALQKIIRENPIKESGNDFISKFKDVLPRLYNVASTMKAKKEKGETGIDMLLDDAPDEDKDFKKFMFFWFLNEIDVFMSVEENAIILFKNLAGLMKALKNPASYDSLQSLYESLSKTERLEAWAILAKESLKCAGQFATEEDKTAFQEHIKYILHVLKAVLADGQKTTEESITRLVCTEGDSFLKLQAMFEKLDVEEHSAAAKKCVASDSDRELYKTYMDFTKSIYTKEELKELRAKNEKVYAVVFLMNGIAKALVRGHALTNEVDTFLKESITTPHLMAKLAMHFEPSQETVDKIKVEKKRMMEKFNALSDEQKDYLVDLYPYRAVAKLALLD